MYPQNQLRGVSLHKLQRFSPNPSQEWPFQHDQKHIPSSDSAQLAQRDTAELILGGVSLEKAQQRNAKGGQEGRQKVNLPLDTRLLITPRSLLYRHPRALAIGQTQFMGCLCPSRSPPHKHTQTHIKKQSWSARPQWWGRGIAAIPACQSVCFLLARPRDGPATCRKALCRVDKGCVRSCLQSMLDGHVLR